MGYALLTGFIILAIVLGMIVHDKIVDCREKQPK